MRQRERTARESERRRERERDSVCAAGRRDTEPNVCVYLHNITHTHTGGKAVECVKSLSSKGTKCFA